MTVLQVIDIPNQSVKRTADDQPNIASPYQKVIGITSCKDTSSCYSHDIAAAANRQRPFS